MCLHNDGRGLLLKNKEETESPIVVGDEVVVVGAEAITGFLGHRGQVRNVRLDGIVVQLGNMTVVLKPSQLEKIERR